MISTIIAIFFPSFLGLYTLYQNQKHRAKAALRYYIILFYTSNIISVLVMRYILKKEFSFGPNFSFVYVIMSMIISYIVAKLIILNNHNFQFSIEKSKDQKKKHQIFTAHLILILATILAGGLAYYRSYFTYTSLENLFFALGNNMAGTSMRVIKTISVYLLAFFAMFYSVAAIFIFPHKYNLILTANKKRYRIIPVGLFANHIIKGSLFVLFAVLFYASITLNAYEFIGTFTNPSQIYEEYYIDPAKVKITFPENKKNVIHIILESMENSLFSKENGGGYNESIIPELEKLALDNTSFTSKDAKLSGLMVPNGCNWTAAGMVCQSAGVGLRYGMSIKENTKMYLPGAFTLGDILNREGYEQKIIMGSDGSFNNRSLYYETHGKYQVLDLQAVADLGYLPQGYRNDWWGFDDSTLYEISKSELSQLAEGDKPFAYTMLTVDTHFPEGYLDAACPTLYSNQYLSTYSCASSMLGEFMSWLEGQKFYKDTVVVITGDHLTMQDKMFNMFDYEDRFIYNSFINSSVRPKTEFRKGSSFDVFPTILRSMGVTIEGDRLGLGTDLYSQTPTLLEELGYDKFKKETSAISHYYINNIAKESKGGK